LIPAKLTWKKVNIASMWCLHDENHLPCVFFTSKRLHHSGDGELCPRGLAWWDLYPLFSLTITHTAPANTGFPCILENLEDNKFIFQVMEMSLNWTKSGNVSGRNVDLYPLRTKKPVEENFNCRRKSVQVLISDVS